MAVNDRELKPLRSFKRGVNNLSSENELRPDELRQSVNVDLDRQGKPQRRQGYTNIHAGRAHSVYGSPIGLLCAIDGDLRRFCPNFGALMLVPGVGERPISYDTINGTVFWTNGLQIGRIGADLEPRNVWIECTGQPDVAPYGTGSLPAGDYQVAVTYLDSSGLESGSSLATLVTLDSPGGILVSGILDNAEAARVRIFCTPCNGDVLYEVDRIPSGVPSYIIGALPRGNQLETQWHQLMPAGQIIRSWNARTLVAKENIVWHSDAYRYGLHLPGAYTRYSDYVSMVRPVGNADMSCVFIAAGDKTYALTGTGDPKGWKRVVAYPHGAIEGTDAVAEGSIFDPKLGSAPVGYWIADNGVPCIGLPTGQVQPRTNDRFAAPLASRGATLLRERGGIRQMLSTLLGSTANSAAVGDFATASVIRNGVELP